MEILKNKYRIPVYSMDDLENLSKVLVSKEFSEIYSSWVMQMPPNYKLDGIPEFEKRMAFYLIYTGQDQCIDQVSGFLYKRHMPTITEFLTKPEFMGNSYATIYTYWREQLKKIFDPNQGFYECLAGDTVVNLLNNTTKTISELYNSEQHGKGNWVYTWNEQQHTVEPGEIECVWPSGIKDVVKVTLDNGESFTCTPNHKFLTRKNKWVEIQHLKAGDSLMPFEKFYDSDNQEVISIPQPFNNCIAEHTNNLIAKWKYGKNNFNVIHKDGDSHNNIPSNLLLDKNKKEENPIKVSSIKDVKIVSIEHLVQPQLVYNISIRGNHNYVINSSIYTKNCIFRGAIGTGKSTIARRALLYVLYRACCIREPHSFFNIDMSTVISIIMVSITLDHAYNTQLKPMLELLRNTPCFHEVRKITSFDVFGPKDPVPFCRQGKNILFPNNIMLSVGSNNNHVVGMSPLGCLTEDMLIKTNKGDISIKDLTEIDLSDITVFTREQNGKIVKSKIKHAECTRRVNELIELELTNGKVIKCTLNHKFPLKHYNKQDSHIIWLHKLPYKEAQYLNCEDILISSKDIRIKSIKTMKLDKPVNVYNLEVDNENHNYLLSADIFSGNSCFDEAEEKSQEEAFSLYMNLRERIRSRFMGSNLTFCSLISSSKSKSGMVWEYINKIKPEDKTTLLLDPAQWEVKKDAFTYSGNKFWIYIGTKTHPSKILPHEYDNVPKFKLNYVPPAGCELLEVPIELLRDFENNLEGAIQNLAGKTTDTSDRPFDDLSLLGDCKNLLPELHLEAPLGDTIHLFDKLPKELFQKTTVGIRLKRYPNAPRAVHVDLASQSTSQAGYSLWHKEYIVTATGDKETVYVADFISWITAPNRIDHDAIKQLSLDLRDRAGVYIKTISYDQFQCLTGDTEIVLGDNYKTISMKELSERFNKDFYTYSLLGKNKDDFISNKLRIKKCWKSCNKQIMKVYLDNGDVIRCTNDHRFLLKDLTYKQAKDLTIKDDLMSNNICFLYNKQQPKHIIKTELTDTFEDVYDLEVETFDNTDFDQHNFLLKSGVFVHNSEYVRQSLQQHHEFEKVLYQSVDRTITAYMNFAQWMITGKIKVGDCPYLREQLGHIGVTNGKIVTTMKKDMADSCLSFDTKVFLLSGKVITIEELYNSDVTHEWVLACDIDNKKLMPVRINKVLRKHIPDKLIKFTFNNGKELKVTEDHLILMRNGEYKRADAIQEQDELMPFNYYHELNYHDRYRKVVNPFKGTSKFLYKIVSQETLSEAIRAAKQRAIIDGSSFTVIHHISHNKNDDRPENLRPLTNIEHTNLHAMTGKEIKAFHDRSVMKRARSRIINQGLSLMKKVNPDGYRRYLLEHDLADQLAESKAKVENTQVYVINIETVKNDKPVYDIVLDSIHNFALDCNCFVHNCVGAVQNLYLDGTPVEYPFIETEDSSTNIKDIIKINDKDEEWEVI